MHLLRTNPRTPTTTSYAQKPEELAAETAAKAPAIELPKLRKVAVAPKEEPVKKEVKKTKVKIPKAKKYEELPEIADYERPELEKYEASDFDPTVRTNEPLKHAVPTEAAADAAQPQQATASLSAAEPKKNGLAQVGCCRWTELELGGTDCGWDCSGIVFVLFDFQICFTR